MPRRMAEHGADYEQALAEGFFSVRKVADADGFKVIEAVKGKA